MKIYGVLCDGGAWNLDLCNLKFHRDDSAMAKGGGLITEDAHRRLWFGPRPIHVRFKVGILARKQLFSEHFNFSCH